MEEIFGKFNETVRNEIRRTFKTEDLYFKINDSNFEGAYELYKNFEYSQGRIPFPLSAMKGYKIFSAYYKNQLISLILYIDSFPYLRTRSICSRRLQIDNKELYKIIGYASKRLVYEICKYGKENSYRLLDLASINLTDSKKSGVAQFKSGFGGKIEDEYTYIYKSKLFKFFEKLTQIKLFVLKIIYKIKNKILNI